MMKRTAAIILAAGKGTRMKSSLPKVMHKIANEPMIGWVLKTTTALDVAQTVAVIAPDHDVTKTYLGASCSIAYQETALGTAHAVSCAEESLKSFKGRVLVIYGDGPLYTAETLNAFLNEMDQSGAPIGFLGMYPDDPTGYGRMITNKNDYVVEIIEEKDASTQQKKINLCWTGVMAADASILFDLLKKIDNDNAKGEYYLTTLPRLAAKQGLNTIFTIAPVDETLGANNFAELAILESKIQNRLRRQAMDNGVRMVDPLTVYLSADTEIASDVVIEPNVYFGPHVRVGTGVHIHAYSHIEGAMISEGASIGPFARIRPHSKIGKNAVVGNFIEVNRSELKDGAKSKHISYLGDAVIGAKTNIGAGTIIANYDGFIKHETHIGEGVFVGSNSTIIAPISVKDGAIIAAGSVITEDIGKDTLGIARSPQKNMEGWASSYRARKKEEKSA